MIFEEEILILAIHQIFDTNQSQMNVVFVICSHTALILIYILKTEAISTDGDFW